MPLLFNRSRPNKPSVFLFRMTDSAWFAEDRKYRAAFRRHVIRQAERQACDAGAERWEIVDGDQRVLAKGRVDKPDNGGGIGAALLGCVRKLKHCVS